MATKELDEMTQRYRAFNDQLERNLEDIPNPKPVEPIQGKFSVTCDTCNKQGPPGETIFSGTMAAQKAGYTYDSESLRAGKKVKWYCPEHGREKK